ncbi:MAG: hypothetical protein BVN35_19735 [Proteobacteria bacterium ST_bin11]|nr:MAG: hypothetical protein BVN35_19735 [Proteobacteria bacterium ST_bin11]
METVLASLLASVLLLGTNSVLAENISTPDNKIKTSSLFNQTLKLHNISFQVTSEGNKLRILPSGLEIDNSPIDRDIVGTVTGADIGDINIDRSPEIYVYIKDAKGSVSLIAFSANKRKSLSEIYLPPFTDDPQLAKGYRGHDDIAMVEGIVALRFPIYKDSDPDDKPTGGMRQLQYKLKQGEASWVLKLDKVIGF